MADLKGLLRGRGRIRATGRLPEIDAYIRMKHGSPRALTPRESAVMQTEVNAQMRVIRRNWPTDTGTSRAGWSAFIEGNAGQVAIVYLNNVYYSGWVTRKGQTPVREGGRPWYQTLVTEVFKANKARLVRRVREEIDKTERELRRGTEFEQVGQRVPAYRRPGFPFGQAKTFQDLLKRMEGL